MLGVGNTEGRQMKYCETCKFRDGYGICSSKKLTEYMGRTDDPQVDMLVYSYNESGSFWVGPKFGCVHHAVVESK